MLLEGEQNVEAPVKDQEETASNAPEIEDGVAELQAAEESFQEDASLPDSDNVEQEDAPEATETQEANEETAEQTTEAIEVNEEGRAEMEEGEKNQTENAEPMETENSESAIPAEVSDMKIPKQENSTLPGRKFRIFVGTIAKGTTHEELKGHFEPLGAVVETFKAHTARPFAFITVKSQEIRDKLCNDTQTLKGAQLNLQPAKPKTKKFFVGGVTNNTTNEMMETHFGQYATVQEAFIVKGRGFAFVTVEADDSQVFTNIVKMTHNIDGRDVDVKFAQPKPEGGPRGRGGRGGFNRRYEPYGGEGDRKSVV